MANIREKLKIGQMQPICSDGLKEAMLLPCAIFGRRIKKYFNGINTDIVYVRCDEEDVAKAFGSENNFVLLFQCYKEYIDCNKREANKNDDQLVMLGEDNSYYMSEDFIRDVLDAWCKPENKHQENAVGDALSLEKVRNRIQVHDSYVSKKDTVETYNPLMSKGEVIVQASNIVGLDGEKIELAGNNFTGGPFVMSGTPQERVDQANAYWEALMNDERRSSKKRGAEGDADGGKSSSRRLAYAATDGPTSEAMEAVRRDTDKLRRFHRFDKYKQRGVQQLGV